VLPSGHEQGTGWKKGWYHLSKFSGTAQKNSGLGKKEAGHAKNRQGKNDSG